jgi:hypothetical protein
MTMNDKLPEPGTGVRGEKLSDLPTGPSDYDTRVLDPRHYQYEHSHEELAAAKAEQEGTGVMGMASEDQWQEIVGQAALQGAGSVLGAVTGAAKGLAEGAEGAAEEVGGEAEKLTTEPMSAEDQWGFSARPMAESAADCYKRKFGGGR